MNSANGACVRYLNARKRDKYSKLRALFVHGNSGLNIRTDGKAFFTTLEKELVLSVFGNGPNPPKKYAFGHGMARDGFHITSCQFALHYFFENKTLLHGFLRNVTECTKTGGYFIGTCFDGQKVFDWLRRKKEGESIRIEKNGRKIFEITKQYTNEIGDKFEPDETSIGKAIYVYQESIDKVFCEYLVNFEYFCRLMENYGFLPASSEELRSFGSGSLSVFPSPNGSFDRLFSSMEKELSQNQGMQDYNHAPFMTFEEKTISNLNRYFIFKKVRHISAEMLKTIHVVDLEEKEKEEESEKESEKKTETKTETKSDKKEDKTEKDKESEKEKDKKEKESDKKEKEPKKKRNITNKKIPKIKITIE
jgi:hypothetical protein